MSIRNATDAALFTRLSTASVLTLAPGGVYNGVAPAHVAEPFVVFDLLTERSEPSVFDRRSYQLVYTVKGITAGQWTKLASDIDDACDALLDGKPLAIAGGAHLATNREEGINYHEDDTGSMYAHVGGVYRIWVDV